MQAIIWLLIGSAVGGVAHFVGRGPRYPLFGALSLGMLGSSNQTKRLYPTSCVFRRYET